MVHFVGLAMGIGTSFGYLFLGIAGAKMEKGEALNFMMNTFSLSKMGTIGITLLVLSGGFLITPYIKHLGSYPFLIAKLSLVAILIALIIYLNITVGKAKKGNPEVHLKKIRKLGPVSLLIGLSIIVCAVLNFH